MKDLMYFATMHAVLLCGCGTWSLLAECVIHLEVFDHRCFLVWLRLDGMRGRVSHMEVMNLVLGAGSKEILSVHEADWLGHVLRIWNIFFMVLCPDEASYFTIFDVRSSGDR